MVPGGGWPTTTPLRAALAVNCGLLIGAVGVAIAEYAAGGWGQNVELLLTLTLFAAACELLATPSPRLSWVVTSSAPYVLTIVLLDAHQALLVGMVGLSIDSIRRRPGPGIVVGNFANYALFLVAGSLLFGWLIDQWQVEPADPSFMVVVLLASVWVNVVSDLASASYSWAEGLWVKQCYRLLLAPQMGAEIPSTLLAAATAYLYGLAGVPALALLAIVQLTFQFFVKQLTRSQERADDLRRRIEEISALSASRARLLQQLLDAEDHERKRLAGVLHDDALQNLLAARQDLASFKSDRFGRRAAMTVETVIDQLRREIFELHPGVLRKVGLESALRAVAERHASVGGFSSRIAVDSTVPATREPLLFGLGREFLNNAARHAEPNAVSLHVRRLNGSILLEAHDDGRGFEPSRIEVALGKGHIGLASCRERVEALGGSLEVLSGTGRGTTIRASVPVD